MNWQLYGKYQKETFQQHKRAFQALLPPPYGDMRVFDVGCGPSPLSLHVMGEEPAIWDGWDKKDADFTTEEGIHKIAARANELEATVVISTFASEVFAPGYLADDLYNFIFRGAPTVGRILVSGICYPDDDKNEFEEPFHHYAIDPYPVRRDTWHEEIFVHEVTSTMFGIETEVWRLLVRKNAT